MSLSIWNNTQLPMAYNDVSAFANTDDNMHEFEEDEDDEIIQSGTRVSKIHSNGRGAPLMPQAVIVMTLKINPSERLHREQAWGAQYTKVYAPHADNPDIFNHAKGRLAFCILEPTLRKHTAIPGDTSLESHNVVNGLKTGIRVGLWHVQQLVKTAEEDFGDQRQTSIFSGTQTILNTGDETIYAGQLVYGDLNPVKMINRGKEEPGFQINGSHHGAFQPRTRGLDSNTVHAIVHHLRTLILDYIYAIPNLEHINTKTNAIELLDWFNKTVDNVCDLRGLAEDIPIRPLLRVWLPFHWSKMIKLKTQDGLFFQLAAGANNTLGKFQHRVLALNVRLLAQRQAESTSRSIREEFDRGLPHTVPGASKQSWRDASQANQASMFCAKLEKLIHPKELNTKLAADVLAAVEDVDEAEAKLDLNYQHVSEVCLFAQQYHFQTQTFARALWTAAPGEPMASHLR